MLPLLLDTVKFTLLYVLVAMGSDLLDSCEYTRTMYSMLLYWIVVLLPGSAIHALDISKYSFHILVVLN